MFECSSEKFLEFRDYIKKSRSFAVTGLTSILRILLLKLVSDKKKILLITASEQNALKFQNDFKKVFDLDSSIIPFQNISMYENVSRNLYEYAQQIEVLRGNSNIVICPVKSLLEKFPKPEFFEKNLLKIKVGDELDLKELSEKLTKLGYKRSTMVSDIGEYSIRGDIADIYSLSSKPVRIELWGDEVVDIRYFDNETQKSISKAKETEILPMYKFILNESVTAFSDEEGYFEGIEVYQNYFNDDLVGVLDYLRDYVLVFDETSEIYSK